MDEHERAVDVVGEIVVWGPSDLAAAERFGAVWEGAARSAEQQMAVAWFDAIQRWLKNAERKSGSRHTRSNYERAVKRWLEFLVTERTERGAPVQLWEVDSMHVQRWLDLLSEAGNQGQPMAATTVNLYLSAVSSLYAFVIADTRMVNGMEVSLFVDASGRTRFNPFHHGNVRRPKTIGYARARPLTKSESSKLLGWLVKHQESPSGARNFALVLTYMLTGFRNSELMRMQWKQLRPHHQGDGAMMYAWKGKGNKREEKLIPARAWHAICHYLKVTGRYVPEVVEPEPDDFVWVGLRMEQCRNLAHADEQEEGGHLSSRSALRIFKTCLRQAGIQRWREIRLHDARHTFGRALVRGGVPMNRIKDLMGHAHLNTTDIYTKKIGAEDELDNYSEALYVQMTMP